MLKGATAAAVGATGLGMTGTAAAGDYGCDYHFPDAPSWMGYVQPEHWNFHNWPWGANDMTIFIHGFTNDNGGRDYAYEIYNHLSDHGYGGYVMACDWNAGNSWDDWYWAKNHAIEAGKDLAQILAHYGWTEEGGVNVNLIAHSLGGKMALETVRSLHYDHGNQTINTVHLLGGAVYDRAMYLEDPECRFHYPVAHSTNDTHNYYSYNDDVLEDMYQSAEGGRHACGYSGAVGEPANWHEHDMTDRIHQHCEYMDYNAGVLWWVDDDLY